MKFLVFLLTLTTGLTFAQSRVSIVVQKTKGYSDPDDPGYVNKIISLLKEEGLKSAIFNYRPLKRALHEHFGEKKHECFMGADKYFAKFFDHPTEGRLFSLPYDRNSIILYARENKYCSPKNLKDKNLILFWNFPADKLLKDFEIGKTIKVYSVDQGIKMLSHGRAQAFAAFYPSPYKKVRNLKTCKENSLLDFTATIQCYDSPSNRIFLKDLNSVILKIYKNGKIRKAMDKFFPEASEESYKHISPL